MVAGFFKKSKSRNLLESSRNLLEKIKEKELIVKY